MFDLSLGAYLAFREISSEFSDSRSCVEGIRHSNNVEITAARRYAAIKTLQSRKAPEREDKDEGKPINEGQRTLMVSTTRTKSSCIIGSCCRWLQTVHEHDTSTLRRDLWVDLTHSGYSS